MNFLAHLLTGDTSDAMLVGSFAGDFCRGGLDRQPRSLRDGIRLHRMVDAFADTHPSFSLVRARLRPSLGLYAPVGADMLIDHLLAEEWRTWVRPEELRRFADRAGAVLMERRDWLPGSGARIATMMVSGRWLESYAEKDGIRTALERMTMRTRRNIRLADALLELDRNEDEIRSSIREFLSDLFSSAELVEAGMRTDLSPESGGGIEALPQA